MEKTKTADVVATLRDRVLAETSIIEAHDVRGDYELGHIVTVRVWPDGTIDTVVEAGYTIGEDEYNHRVPHQLSVWSTTATGPWDDPESYPLGWDESEEKTDYIEIEHGLLTLMILEDALEYYEGAKVNGFVVPNLTWENLDIADDDQDEGIKRALEEWIAAGNYTGQS